MGNVFSGIANIGTLGASGALFGSSSIFGGKGTTKSADQKMYGKTGAQYLKLLKAYGAGLPQQLAWEQQYKPQYDAVTLQSYNDTLNGVGGKPGYLSLYENDVVPTITRATTAANTALRTSNRNDLSTLGPDVLAAIKAANPGQTGLMDKLTSDAQVGLDAGSQLTGDQFRTVNNAVNASNATRGVAYGPAASYAQVLANSGYGDQQYQQRHDNATQVAGLNNDYYTKQILNILGMDSTAPNAGQPLTSTGAQFATNAGPTLFSSSDSTSLFNAIFNQNAANSIASKNNQTALIGAGIGAIGSLGGGALSAI